MASWAGNRAGEGTRAQEMALSEGAQDSRRQDEGDSKLGERLLFTAYLVVIMAGLALFFVAGVTHR